MIHSLCVALQFEFQLDGLLQTLEAPVSFLYLECGNAEEFIDGFFGVVYLQLLGVVVLVFDIDVAALLFIIVFVLKVVAERS